MAIILVIPVLIVAAIDYAIFHSIDKLARHLDPSRLAVTEAVFGVLLAVLAVELMVDNLVELGIIEAIAH